MAPVARSPHPPPSPSSNRLVRHWGGPPAPTVGPSLPVRMLLEPEEGEEGNEWVTRGLHMSLRCRPASYVAVNAYVAWSKPLNVGQNSLALVQVLKVTVLTIGVPILDDFVVEG